MIIDRAIIHPDDPMTLHCGRCGQPMTVCACVPPAEQLILHFLTYVKVARVAYIGRYMESAWRIPHGTTKNTLSKLTRSGHVRRVGYGKYSR